MERTKPIVTSLARPLTVKGNDEGLVKVFTGAPSYKPNQMRLTYELMG